MKKSSLRGIGLVSAIVATSILGLAAVGLVQYSNTVGSAARDANTRTQMDSFKVYQSELALAGVDPSTLYSNPIAGTTKTITVQVPIVTIVPGTNGEAPREITTWETQQKTVTDGMPEVSVVAGASSARPGAAAISAYSAASTDGRANSVGFRIQTSGSSSPVVPSVPLEAPTFNFSGLISEATFASNPTLMGFLTPAPGNPTGTVIRYTTDGSPPDGTSTIWSATSGFTAYVPPATVRAAAFHSDTAYSTSATASASLSRNISVAFGRQTGGTSTAFTYAEVTGFINPIVLSVSNIPPGTTIRYTYDGSAPTPSSPAYAGAFHVPLASWGASGVPLRATAFTSYSNITSSSIDLTLTPTAVPLPTPTFGSFGGTATAVEVPISSGIPGATIVYGINAPITGSSPSISSGQSIVVVAP